MNFIEAIVLGVIQGLTEFLPVSSSGHLELGKAVLGSVPEEGMLMTIVLHFATALSTIVIFRKDILQIFKGLFRFKNNEESKFALMVVISMIPAALIGLLFEDQIDHFFSGSIGLVGAMLIVTGGLLFVADRAKPSEGKVTVKRAAIIGIAQAIAILPGISRSGATIGTSVLLGIDRQRAAKFSFLMVVPLIFGAMAVKVKDYAEVSSLESQSVEVRSEQLTNELVTILEAGYVNKEEVYGTVFHKEEKWEALKKGELNVDGYEKLDYQKDLILLGFTEKQANEIANDKVQGFRSHHKTNVISLIAGFIAAFLTGLFACNWMISLVKRSKLKYFAFYCFALGALAIVWAFL